MSNRITEQYSDYQAPNLAQAQNLVTKIARREGFSLGNLLYSGKVLSDKVGTLIYEGKYKLLGDKNSDDVQVPAVLKVIFTEQADPEPELIKEFNQRNPNARVRLPYVYKHVDYQVQDGIRFMYYIMEKVDGEQFVELPIFDQKLAKRFVSFYKTYQGSNLQPFIDQSPEEKYSLAFVLNRFYRWLKNADKIEPVTEYEFQVINQYAGTVGSFLMGHPMEFMHRHLRMQDFAIIRHQGGDANPEYVIFSVAFFSYMPKFYDLVFHIWHAIEMAYKVDGYKSRHVGEYTDFIEQWLDFYKQHNLISAVDAEKAFWALIGERAAGALIIDLRARKYNMKREAKAAYDHLKKVWSHIFEYSLKKFSKL